LWNEFCLPDDDVIIDAVATCGHSITGIILQANELYEILRCAVPKNRWCKSKQRTINDNLLNWLPDKLKEWLVEVIANDFRIPQEGLQRQYIDNLRDKY
jgi:hypothetical protein